MTLRKIGYTNPKGKRGKPARREPTSLTLRVSVRRNMHADFDAPSFFIGISQSELSARTAKFTGSRVPGLSAEGGCAGMGAISMPTQKPWAGHPRTDLPAPRSFYPASGACGGPPTGSSARGSGHGAGSTFTGSLAAKRALSHSSHSLSGKPYGLNFSGWPLSSVK